MTRRNRLMATLHGEPVDRPAVNFYEVGGFLVNPADTDPYNIYNSPSWQPLLNLAEERTDIIRMGNPTAKYSHSELRDELTEVQIREEDGSRFIRHTIKAPGRILTSLSRRDRDVNTQWQIEHLLKDMDDFKAYLSIPDEFFSMSADVTPLINIEEDIGDKGIVMVDTSDPICLAASLFSMEDFTVFALTERKAFHLLLDKISRFLLAFTEDVSSKFPGHLWRICGPEYATEPYLPPALFREYVVRYTRPIVETVKKHGGIPRIHCHGRLMNILDDIVDMGAMALDPIEPPPQGDVSLSYVRQKYGDRLVLFGNIEVADIENLDTEEFKAVAARSVEEGTAGNGLGFVLMPSAAPYGREISERTMKNYQSLLDAVGA